jgi:CHAD domain-containing protein
MTPGLAGFIASGDDGQTGDDAVAGVLASLAAEFTVRPEHGSRPGSRTDGGTRRLTWLDTFDWRLYRAGLSLEFATARRGGELRLTAGDVVTAQPVTGFQPSRPHLLGDLPDGPVADRIAGLVAPRALLPMVTVTTVATAYRLLNSDDKTVARLVVEHPSVPGAEPRPLPPRLAVTEVRGYQTEARRASRLVGSGPGIAPATEPVFAAALRAGGHSPAGYSNKIDAAITDTMPAPRAAATILLRLLDTVDANVTGVFADTDTEFLHDLRVSVRRTRSALKLFGDALTGRKGLTADELAFFAAEFKWVGDMTTPTRDLDVHLLDFELTAATLAAAKPDDLEPFRVFLEQRRRREFRALTRGLRSQRFTTLTRDWRTRLTALQQAPVNGKTAATVRSGSSGKAAGETAGSLAAERTRAAFEKVVKRGVAITPDSPAESLHDLRKRAKELRYALEFFAPLYDPAVSGKVVGDLKRLQDVLGEFQDTEVQIGEIRALAAAMLAAGEAPAVTLLAMGEVTAGLAARQRAARAGFERRFSAFADIDGQRRMALLLRGTAG